MEKSYHKNEKKEFSQQRRVKFSERNFDQSNKIVGFKYEKNTRFTFAESKEDDDRDYKSSNDFKIGDKENKPFIRGNSTKNFE